MLDILLAGLLAGGQPAAVEARLRAHITVLADDAMAGRAPGTAGETAAVSYVAAELQKAGFAAGAKDGGWYQPVVLVAARPGPVSVGWSGGAIDGEALRFAGPAGGGRIAAARVVFEGKDKAAEVRGALVLIGAGEGGARRRAEEAIGRGAAAVLIVRRELAAGAETVRLASSPPPPIGSITEAGAGRLLAAAGLDGRALLAGEASAAGDLAVTLTSQASQRRFTSYNVVARLAGAKPGSGAVLFTAHWDHLGLCRPEGAPDRICNGAVDNASGVASLIETARGIAAGPRPDRDIVAVATTAEEMGLLGAEAYADDPSVPLDTIVAAFNLDTVAIAPKGLPVGVVGRGTTKLDPGIDAAARSVGRKVDTDEEANVMLQRQDGWALGKRGVPSVIANGAVSDMGRLRGYLAGDYHQPSDDLAHLPDLGGAAEDVRLQVALGRRFGSVAAWPGGR